MSSEGSRDNSEQVPHAATRSDLIHGDTAQIGRSHLSRAFKHLLIALPLPVFSGFLWFCDMLSFFPHPTHQDHLCSVIPYCCDALQFLPVFAAPAAMIFTIVALFYLDHLLSISPIFDPSKTSTGSPSGTHAPGEATGSNLDVTLAVNQDESSDLGQAVHRVLWVLRLSIATACALGLLSAITSIVATVNASLVVKIDSPWSEGPPGEDKAVYKDRVILGYGEAIFEALLAYYMCMTATALSGVKQAAETMAPEGVEGREPLRARLAMAWRRVVEEHWHRRSTLDKAVLCLLLSFVLCVTSFTFCVTYFPFRRLRHVDEGYYIASCLLTPIVVWPTLLVVHGYRSSGSLPRRVPRLTTFAFLLLLATVWALVSFMYTVHCVWALFCDTAESLPLTSPRLYVSPSDVWTCFIAVLLGYLQAWCLGAAAVAVRRSGSGVLRIEEGGGV